MADSPRRWSRSRTLAYARARLPRREGVERFVREWAAATLAALVALVGVGKVGEDVFAHESGSFDDAVQRWMMAHQRPSIVTIFGWITTVGAVPAVTTLGLIAALFLYHRKGRRVAAAAVVAPAIAISVFLGAKQIYARPRPTGFGHVLLGSYSFPSGHATASTAIFCTLAYICWREHLVHGALALSFAITAPLLIGISRVYLDYHWATDVLGGWSAGLLVAVCSVALYDRSRYRLMRDSSPRGERTPPAVR